MKTHLKTFGIAAIMLSLFMVGTVMAAGTYYNYNLTVPKFGGSATTNNQTKVSNADNSVVCSQLIGSTYKMDARIQYLSGSAASSWAEINDYTRREYVTSASASDVLHARLKNKVTTPVDVQAIGKWSPDRPSSSCGF